MDSNKVLTALELFAENMREQRATLAMLVAGVNALIQRHPDAAEIREAMRAQAAKHEANDLLRALLEEQRRSSPDAG